MHSRIYALRAVSENMPKKYEMLSEENLDFDLVSSFADYVTDSDLENDLKWLENHLNHNREMITIDKKETDTFITFYKSGVEDYLKDLYLKFLDNVEKLTREDFYSPYNDKMFEIMETIEGNNFGFHIGEVDDYYGFNTSYDTLEYFFRSVLQKLKKGQEIIERYDNTWTTTLWEVYKTFSYAKHLAYEKCLDVMRKMDGYGLKVLGGSNTNFSVAFKTDNGLVYITFKNTYIVK